jgi:hypothetical protein
MPERNKRERRAVKEPLRIKKFVQTVVAKDQARKRTELLLNLVNLPDHYCEQFRRRFGNLYRLPGDDPLLLECRNQLRRLWSGDRSAGFLLESWVRQANRSAEPSWVLTVFGDGQHGVRPNVHVFPLSLAFGATELASKMALCANPDCPARYFLKGRKSQRFCDRPACAVYGQREHKKTWWRKHSQEWKAKRERLRARKPKDTHNRNRKRKRKAERKIRGKHANAKKA